MTNEQIIEGIAVSVYGKDAVTAMVEQGRDIPLHTVKGWAARGPFRVKKGEHGIETRLWKKKKKKDSSAEQENPGEVSDRDFYMAKAYLFRGDQIEVVQD